MNALSLNSRRRKPGDINVKGLGKNLIGRGRETPKARLMW